MAENLMTVLLPIDSILVDEEFNARKMRTVTRDGEDIEEYEGVTELAKQIKTAGRLLSPILVQAIPEEELAGLREEWGNNLLQYRLVAGFRRTAAMTELEETSISAIIFEGDAKDAYFANLAENIQRKDLTSYEKAVRFVEMREELDISGGEIARKLGEGRGHVNNLIRIIDNCNPRILELWQAGHGKATTDALAKKIVKKDSDHDEQWAAWEKHCGLVEDEFDTKGGEEGDGGDGDDDKASKISRPSVKKLEEALSALRYAEGVSDEYLRGVKATLKYAAAKSKTIPHCWNPNKPPKNGVNEEAQA